jgi:hypothetical protein
MEENTTTATATEPVETTSIFKGDVVDCTGEQPVAVIRCE